MAQNQRNALILMPRDPLLGAEPSELTPRSYHLGLNSGSLLFTARKVGNTALLFETQ